LGVLYEHGWGVAEDFAQARRWYQQCAAPRFFVGTGQVQRRIIS
jgi:hypothetical protein